MHYQSIIRTLYPKLMVLFPRRLTLKRHGVRVYICVCVLVLTCIIYTACLHCLGTLLFSVGVKHAQRAQLSSVHQQPLHNISGPV